MDIVTAYLYGSLDSDIYTVLLERNDALITVATIWYVL